MKYNQSNSTNNFQIGQLSLAIMPIFDVKRTSWRLVMATRRDDCKLITMYTQCLELNHFYFLIDANRICMCH